MQNQSWRPSKDEASRLVFGKSRLNRQVQFKETQNSNRILKQQTADISRILEQQANTAADFENYKSKKWKNREKVCFCIETTDNHQQTK